MSQLFNFDKPVIGHFEIPLRDFSGVKLHMEITATYSLYCSFNAAIVVKSYAIGDKNYIMAVKLRNDVLTVSSLPDYTIPTDTTGLMVPYELTINEGERIAFYAGNTKYYAICSFAHESKQAQRSSYKIDIPYGRNPCILDEIEKCVSTKMIMRSLPDDTTDVKTDVKTDADADVKTNAKTDVNTDSIKIGFEIKRGKCAGVDCWVMPSALRGSYRAGLDRVVDTKKWKVVYQEAGGDIHHTGVSGFANQPTTMHVDGDWSRFWIVDKTDESIVDVKIISIAFDY